MPTTPTPADRPADQLRAAAERARETGDPLHTVVADLLNRHAKEYDASVAAAANVWPDSADEAARWLAAQVPPEALAVARQLLGTTSEAKRNEIRQSYSELAAQAREDRDHEGAADVELKLRDREEQWRREDAAAVETAEEREQREDRKATDREHAVGIHTHCGLTCEVDLPTEHLRNFVIAKGYPGTAGALDELLRRAAAPPAPANRSATRDRIRRAICEASGFTWLPDELMEPDEYGEHADAVLAVLDAPADRAAVLREADWIVEHCPDHGCVEPSTAVCHCEIADRLRRLAGEAAAGAHRTEQAHPAEHSWAAELHDPTANEWVPFGSSNVRDTAVHRLAHARKVAPLWKDGTPTERRLVRATTTYIVEPTPAVPAAPEEQGR